MELPNHPPWIVASATDINKCLKVINYVPEAKFIRYLLSLASFLDHFLLKRGSIEAMKFLFSGATRKIGLKLCT